MYRRSAIGMRLIEALDDMVSAGSLDPDLAIRVLLQFDKVRTYVAGESLSDVRHGTAGWCSHQLCVLLFFSQSMSAALEHKVTSRAAFKGNLHTYNYCDNVWTFRLTDVTFRNEAGVSNNIGKVKIVACDSSLTKP